MNSLPDWKISVSIQLYQVLTSGVSLEIFVTGKRTESDTLRDIIGNPEVLKD